MIEAPSFNEEANMQIDIEKVKDYSGRSGYELNSLAQKGYFKNFTPLTSKKLKSISEEDFEIFKKDIDFERSSYTITEVSKLFKVNHRTTLDYLKKNHNESIKKPFIKQLIQKEVIHKIILELGLNILDDDKYICFNDTMDIDSPTYVITNKICEYIEDRYYFYHPIRKKFYFHRDVKEEFLRYNHIFHHYYTNAHIQKLLQASEGQMSSYASRIYNHFESHIHLGKYHYFDPHEVADFVERTTQLGLESPIDYFNKEKNGTVIRKPSQALRKFDGIDYVSTNYTGELFKCHPSTIINNIKRGIFKQVKKLGSRYYILKTEVEDVVDYLNDTVQFTDIDETIITRLEGLRILNKGLILTYFPNAAKIGLFGPPAWRIPKSDLKYYVEEIRPTLKKQEQLNTIEDPYQIYDDAISHLSTNKYVNSVKAFRNYAYKQIGKTSRKDIKGYAKVLARTTTRVISLLSDEFYLCNDLQLMTLFRKTSKEGLSSEDKLHFSALLNQFQENNPTKCKYYSRYNRYIVTKDNKEEKDFFPYEVWMYYYRYLTNINLHIVHAFENENYAKHCFFCILHLSIAWRSGDLKSLPPFYDIENIDIYNLEWFKNHDFTYSEGDRILSQAKILVDGIKASKNKMLTHFVFAPSVVVPTAIALIANNYHAHLSPVPWNTLFNITRFQKSSFNDFFQPKELKDFSNKRACSSLMTHVFNEAVQSEGMSHVAYSLGTYLRSHRTNENTEQADSTVEYIYSTNSDGDSSKVAKHLLDRGAFGWMYKALIELSSFDINMDINCMTNLIEHIADEYNPYAIEALSGSLLNDYAVNKEILQELINMPRDRITNILEKFNKYQIPSKTDFVSCIKYDGYKLKCPYGKTNNCLICDYKIPTLHSLSILKSEIDNQITCLENTPIENYHMRKKYSYLLDKLLIVLSEACMEMNNIESNIIHNYFDIQMIQKKIILLKKTKYLD